jgi:hypothetical protein
MSQRLEQEKIDDIKRREELFKERIAEKYGDYMDWYEWATSHYVIEEDNRVVSKAKKWEEEISWNCGSRIEALEKIKQLVSWREYNTFRRNK